MWDNRWGIFLEGVTPEVDLGQFGIHSKADKETLLITSTDRVYLSSSREAQERQVQGWHDNSTVSSKTQMLFDLTVLACLVPLVSKWLP